MALLNNELKDLYSNYYAGSSSLEYTRSLSAKSIIDHLNEVCDSAHRGRIINVGAGNGSVLPRLEETAKADELSRVAKEVVLEVPLEGVIKVAKSIALSEKFGHLNFYSIPSFLYLLKTAGLAPTEYVVTTSSADYERDLYGPVKGTIKSALRRGALRYFPNLAPFIFVYVLTVRSQPKAIQP